MLIVHDCERTAGTDCCCLRERERGSRLIKSRASNKLPLLLLFPNCQTASISHFSPYTYLGIHFCLFEISEYLTLNTNTTLNEAITTAIHSSLLLLENASLNQPRSGTPILCTKAPRSQSCQSYAVVKSKQDLRNASSPIITSQPLSFSSVFPPRSRLRYSFIQCCTQQPPECSCRRCFVAANLASSVAN